MFEIINSMTFDQGLVRIGLHDKKILHVQQQEGFISSEGAASIFTLNDFSEIAENSVIDAQGEFIIPGLIDAHVHSRDPGYTDKESWRTLAKSAFKGGVVAVCDMPNTNPPVLTPEVFEQKVSIASDSGLDCRFFLGVGRSNIDQLASYLGQLDLAPLCGLKIFYGQSTGEMMFSDLDQLGRALPGDFAKPLVFHSEDQATIDGNLALQSFDARPSFAGFSVHSQVRSPLAAVTSTKKIIEWARRCGFKVHLAHISTVEEIELVAMAQARGVKLTAEVAPHHLFFNSDDYPRLGPFLKMNPPVRGPLEAKALGKAFAAGKFDLFATDHAPHTRAEKLSGGYGQTPSGIPGIEFFLPLLFKLADEFGLGEEKALIMATSGPAQLFGFQDLGRLAAGYDASMVWVTKDDYRVANQDVEAKCGWSPYVGVALNYKVQKTWHRGRLVYAARSR